MKKPYEMVQEFTADKLMTDETKFEVTKLVEAVMGYEREKVLEWAKAKVRGHRELAIKAQDAGDDEKASTHIAIETAYFGIVKEIDDCEHHKSSERSKI